MNRCQKTFSTEIRIPAVPRAGRYKFAHEKHGRPRLCEPLSSISINSPLYDDRK